MLAVVPFAVDTPMVREVMQQSAEVQPVTAELRRAASHGELATPVATAKQIWAAVADGTIRGRVRARRRTSETTDPPGAAAMSAHRAPDCYDART